MQTEQVSYESDGSGDALAVVVPYCSCCLCLYRIWDLIVSVPDHCLSFYFERYISFKTTTYCLSVLLCKLRSFNNS